MSRVSVSGFTILRNGVQFDYPFEESIRSLFPLVDELVVNVGYGTDETLSRVKALANELGKEKFIIFESNWHLDDENKKKEGLILSEQTNLALDRCTHDWCVYLQADEVLHSKDHPLIRESLQVASLNPEVEGLVFDYLHFYGSL